nr:MAG TPA: hypothetical protein [Caudoviricetes sp.]
MKTKRQTNIKLLDPLARIQIMEVIQHIKSIVNEGYSIDNIIEHDDADDPRPCQIIITYKKDVNNK